MYKNIGFLSKKQEQEIVKSIKIMDERKVRKLLFDQFDNFKRVVIESVTDGEVGAEYIIKQVEEQLGEIYKQLSIYDI